ncbi:hypothetical protein LSUCC0031_00200 [Rhodobacterales bacterium LSUCC0031]|nr:hypothetical protein [Rhodobacterales bacterium LSUCC0031]
MTQSRLAGRNRANAAKSTGPKTRRGKAKSAQNARRHGATGAPPPKAVAAWLSVILDRPQMTPRNLVPADEAGRTTLALAHAEARLAAADDALAACEAEDEAPRDDLAELEAMAEHIRDALIEPETTPSQRRSGAALLLRVAKARVAQAEAQARRHRLLTRYAREARAARSRAIAAWASAAAAETHATTGPGR